MKILYIHGFGSRFDRSSEKVQALEDLGPVYGVNLHYPDGYARNKHECIEIVRAFDIDLVVGTSMGGYMAAQIGTERNLPFVCINPAISPNPMLRKYVGTHVDYHGREYTMTEDAVESYPPMSIAGDGLILLDMGDDVIDAHETVAQLERYYDIVTFHGGSHRFDNIVDSLPIIERFVLSPEVAA